MRGHRVRAHTADVIVEAWAPTRVACLEEAVLGLVDAFADVGALLADTSTRRDRLPVDVDPADDEELLVALLEHVVYAIDARDVVPVAAALEGRSDGGVSGWFETVSSEVVSDVGATPKGVSRSDLSFGEEAGTWRCRVEIDV